MKFWSKILLITFILLISVFLSSGEFVSTVYAVSGNNALSFNGTAAYVDCGNILVLTTNLTVEAWVFTDGTNPDRTIVAKFGQSNGDGIGYGLGISNNQPYFLVANDNPGAKSQSPTGLTANKWHHIAGTYDGTTIKIYIDGIEMQSVAYDGGIGNSSTNLFIGRQNDVNPNLFSGKIDEVRIWNTARNAAEIRGNMHRQLQDNATGLVGYYKLDTGTGTTALDSSANANNGTLMNGPAWQTSGAFAGPGNALKFDGMDDYVEIPANASLNNNTFTVEFWVMIDAEQGSWPGIVDKGRYHPGNKTDWSFMSYKATNNKVIIFDTAAGSEEWIIINDLQTWNHIAVSYDKEALQASVYLNGVLYSTLSGVDYSSSGNGIRLGRHLGGNHPFNGKLDELRIWNTARTSAQIRDNMARSLQGNEVGLVAYYRMDQQAVVGQTTLYDQSSNGNNGTLNNMNTTTAWVESTAFNTWIGSDSTDWATDANWSRNETPVASDNVGILTTPTSRNIRTETHQPFPEILQSIPCH